MDDIKKLIPRLTLEEKAGLCSGADPWRTKQVERLGIPRVLLSDGPHGLRTQKAEKQQITDTVETISAVCYPTGSCLACSFDPALLRRVGETLGDECRAEGVAVLLGPAVNSKRSPLCGRNFEYYSEDPFLTGKMAAALIQGIQSRGVGTSVKHFAANNQEHRRMMTSANVDERTLREIYLAGFEGAVREGNPWTLMCSYNRINGVYASENHRLLTEILRDEWGFDGLVMSDWGAVNDRVKGIKAGLDLEMPGSGGVNDRKIIKAVQNGTLSERELDRAVECVLRLVLRAQKGTGTKAPSFDRNSHSQISRETARECMVLLKNEEEILPLKQTEKIAFIGEFAKKPRYQGGGSSHVNASRVVSAMDAVDGMANISYSRGYDTEKETADEALEQEAVSAARSSDAAVIFAGLPDRYESEGWDRKHMRLPENQNSLIRKVCKAQPNTVIVLHNGSPVEMPWVNDVKGILEAYLGGQETGGAVADLLFGKANPCGKLAETFPVKLSDNPSYLNFPGDGDECWYREGVFTGYRYYDRKEMPVLFPFGHGLSYTRFSYEKMSLSADEMLDTDTLKVHVTVRNTGKLPGKEIVQLYVADHQTEVTRPLKELKGFAKGLLQPGEAKVFKFELNRRSFAYYDTGLSDWHVRTGTFDILAGASSREIRLRASVRVRSTDEPQKQFTMNSGVGDILECSGGESVLKTLLRESKTLGLSVDEQMEQLKVQFREIPLHTLVEFTSGAFSEKQALQLLQVLNESDESCCK